MLRAEAEVEIATIGGIGMCLLAAEGGTPLFVAASRPYAKGRYRDPLIELITLAFGLGADQLAVGVGARAWSLEDPIAPVTDGADLRQTVLVVTTADAHGRLVPTMGGSIHPYELVDRTVAWRDPVDVGAGEGWITDALRILLTHRNSPDAPTVDPQDQLERCLERGHRIGITPESGARFFPSQVTVSRSGDQA